MTISISNGSTYPMKAGMGLYGSKAACEETLARIGNAAESTRFDGMPGLKRLKQDIERMDLACEPAS